ncbi:hypothetical protein ABIE09_003164 [Lysobacter enzymogenes]|jgi:hypothetical protein|uniref:hypothetical protein n=1 Tax=Lysobacter enzymogenes TaxID=69 RepID=UPI0008987BD6|nr:hypothetical protein [Lysobacter enzymogenes]SDX82693.1 hypothetical protein SAMN05421681_108103 [Lysobacter enzymogenes]
MHAHRRFVLPIALALASALAGAAGLAAAAPASAPAKLRFDGIYQADSGRGHFFYLRFYADGVVVSVSSPEPAQSVNDWFNRNCAVLPRGAYSGRDGRVAFTTQARVGSVEYAATVGPDRLDAHIRSLINGHESDQAFRFVPIARLSEQPSADAPAACRG